MCGFSVHYGAFDTSYIINIHKYLMKKKKKKKRCKIMFGLIKKIFIGLLTSIVTAYNHTKCMFFGNQKCMVQPTIINLYLT